VEAGVTGAHLWSELGGRLLTGRRRYAKLLVRPDLPLLLGERVAPLDAEQGQGGLPARWDKAALAQQIGPAERPIVRRFTPSAIVEKRYTSRRSGVRRRLRDPESVAVSCSSARLLSSFGLRGFGHRSGARCHTRAAYIAAAAASGHLRA
jgi:hypothetical protein